MGDLSTGNRAGGESFPLTAIILSLGIHLLTRARRPGLHEAALADDKNMGGFRPSQLQEKGRGGQSDLH